LEKAKSGSPSARARQLILSAKLNFFVFALLLRAGQKRASLIIEEEKIAKLIVFIKSVSIIMKI
jgi:hypothetical protein